ncbi:U3 small nucleolar ribonucleoprotein protein MPP10-like isoform X2 [Amphiura filiformis]|uniref:U3 small nucleolar ribonucleoprotein protein MPP10-like isoform X2 n=1 Tax=Amphiura filiformis TaxID=82378 RepID=UPI003B219C7D
MATSRVLRHVYSNAKNDSEIILSEFDTATKAPERFISPQVKVASNFTNLTKQIFSSYHQQQSSADNSDDLNILSELIIENFDDEQVWQQIELQNEMCLKHSFKDAAKVIANRDKGLFTSRKSRTKDASVAEEEEEDERGLLEYSGSQDLFPEMQTEEEDGDGEPDDDDDGDDDDDDDDDAETNFDIDAAALRRTNAKKKKSSLSSSSSSKGANKSNMRTSVVDDRFFKLSEMEQFLELEDAREERRRQEEDGKGRRDEDESDQDGEDDDDDESVDYFQELPSDEDEELDEEEDEDDDDDDNQEYKNPKEMLYSDFWIQDPEDSSKSATKEKSVRFEGMKSDDEEEMEDEEEDADEDHGDNEGSEAARKALMGLLGDSDGSDEGEDARDIFGGGGQNDNKSAFEKRQERLKEKIQQLEEVNLATKPWQLSGEVTSGKRPANSLLEEDLDFDATAKAGVEITEETTKSIEDIIRQRILDAAYDDVERKVKPKEDMFEFKKRVTLDQEKSKLSLAEIYEKEYIKQTQGEKEEKQDPAHVEIKTMMDSLFLKLDALSNFHYTPKPAIPEVKIVSNLPSITMEEVAPVTATDATLLAPEEVQEKTQGELKGDTERTETDKKHARRKKKTQQRVRAKEKEKREACRETQPGLGNKYSKQAAMAKLEKSSKMASNRTTIIQEGKGTKKSLTSSKSFFTQLQEEVTAEVHGVKRDKHRKKDKKQISASKLKL